MATVDGRRVEQELPGRLGRLLLVRLVVGRQRPIARDELTESLWGRDAPAAAEASLAALLSRLRRTLGADRVEGRSSIRLALPRDAWVDLEAATEGLHRAESAVAREDWAAAWGPGRVAQHVAARGFLPGDDLEWVVEQRRRLDEIYIRSLELVATACLRLGGGELDTAERTARTLVERAPYRESGYRLLMEVYDARGNPAEALLLYEQLRRRLRDDLGVTPSPATAGLHRRLVGG